MPNDIELINVYVPEAAFISVEDAARLARDRDQAAAEQLVLDTEYSRLNLEAAAKVATMQLV